MRGADGLAAVGETGEEIAAVLGSAFPLHNSHRQYGGMDDAAKNSKCRANK